MRILFTNDDGIFAPGIRALVEAFPDHERVVCAPHTERSAHSHAVTIQHHMPMVEKVFIEGVPGYALEGTPADCTKWALYHIGPFDLVISGINNGINTGTDTHYSGTVSAAMEATLHHIPALAVSLAAPHAQKKDEISYFLPAARLAAHLVASYPPPKWPKFEMLNLNVPFGAENPQLRVCPLGFSTMEDAFEGDAKSGYRLYSFDGGGQRDTDTDMVARGFATLTPLTWDLTAHESLQALNQALSALS